MNNSQNTVQIYTIFPTNNKYNLPPPPTSILLHTLDLSAPLQIRLHRFFHRPPSTFADIIDKLKCSLAEALELYPPVAGIVQANEEGEDCVLIGAGHNQGVPFLVATKDTAFMGDTEDLAPRPDMFLPPSSSTLAVKVTQVAYDASFNTCL
ncbi:hypothetical protein AMATHDRAFT_142019 [Amanita thiersii Skay4041]|uniref:Uncharacterized protein n=1 Tax=Amanita thiersii Skay4041 TaxID=703135 RepID=A0A2A9NTS3_9AGAR|nr:hypothetical protein AMATHDRAFT_142019 [Amanita thiersii Skay4041]